MHSNILCRRHHYSHLNLFTGKKAITPFIDRHNHNDIFSSLQYTFCRFSDWESVHERALNSVKQQRGHGADRVHFNVIKLFWTTSSLRIYSIDVSLRYKTACVHQLPTNKLLVSLSSPHLFCRSNSELGRAPEATQFAVAAANHSALSSDEVSSVEMKSDEVRWD